MTTTDQPNAGGNSANIDAEPADGRYVIVRAHGAGVVCGRFDGRIGTTVYLTEARQMWAWTAKSGGTLIDCATDGVSDGKFSARSEDRVTILSACAVIDCTPDAADTLINLPMGDWS